MNRKKSSIVAIPSGKDAISGVLRYKVGRKEREIPAVVFTESEITRLFEKIDLNPTYRRNKRRKVSSRFKFWGQKETEVIRREILLTNK